ncbi:MAG: restriction endonuclease subunit S [Methanospirillum sp.]
MNPPESAAELAQWREGRLSTLLERTEQVDPVQLGSQFCYIDVSAVSRETLRVEKYAVLNTNEAPSRARKLVREGDVIFATIRPYLKQIAKVPEHLDSQICSTAFCVLRANPSIADPDFIFQAVSSDSFVQKVCEYQTGSNYPAVSDNVIKEQRIVIPPLPEQKRIASVLATVDEVIAATDAVIEEISRIRVDLLKIIFSEGIGSHKTANTSIGMIPSHWKEVPLKKICLSSAYGPRFSSDCYSADGNIALMRTTDLEENGIIHYEAFPFASLDEPIFRDHFLIENDLVISRSGTCGIAAIFKGFSIPVLPGAFLIRFRLNDSVDPEYVKDYLNSPSGAKRLKTLESGGVQKNLSGTSLLQFRIPLPPLSEQRHIAAILSTVDDRLALERAERDRLVALKKGLMQVLLTGKVRVPPGVAEEVAPAHA